MSALLWIDYDAGAALNLGDPFALYAALADMARACGDSFADDYPALFGVIEQVESQDDADVEWLTQVCQEAARFLAQHGHDVGAQAHLVLTELAHADAGK
jgi:hypothetical protein